jgi:hypothetical protein
METTPRKRRHLLRALAETAVLPHRTASLATPSQRPTLGALVRRDPVYAPPTSLLARLGAVRSGECAPPRRNVLVATAVAHPAQARVSPLLGARALHPPRSAANLLHQVLRSLWSLDDIPVAEVPESGALPRADGEACGSAEQRPARSSAPLESQVPPPEEVVEVAEPPQAEARHPQTCERPCGPVSPGARALAAKTGRVHRLDSACGTIKFEDEYTPFAVERPESRGKPSEHKSPCPCECVCGILVVCVDCTGSRLEFLDCAFQWLGPVLESLVGFFTPDASLGSATQDQAGGIAVHGSGKSPALDALLGGQSQGLGMLAGLDLDLGTMRPALSLTALATAGIPGPLAIAPPERPGEHASLLFSLPGDEPAQGREE